MLPDRVSNPGPLTYESGALPIALPFTKGGKSIKWKCSKSATAKISLLNSIKMQCRKRPVAQSPNVPSFCLGPSEITKWWTLVAQIYLSGNSKWMGSSASILGHFNFGLFSFWATTLILGVSSTEVDEYTFRGSNSTVFAFLLSRGQLLKERICSSRSKFFPWRWTPFGSTTSSGETNRKSCCSPL